MWYQYRLTIGFAFRISPHSKRLGRWDPNAGTGHTARHGSLPVHRLQRCPAECFQKDQSQCRLWVLTHCVRVWVSIFYSRALERNSNSIIVLHFLFYFFSLPFLHRTVPPILWTSHQLVGIPLGYNVTLECITEAHPTSLNYWTRENDQMIHESAKYKWVYFNNCICSFDQFTTANTLGIFCFMSIRVCGLITFNVGCWYFFVEW